MAISNPLAIARGATKKEPLSALSLLVVLCLIGFAAVSVDTIVPGLPSIALHYEVSEQAAQLVLSSFTFGAAVGTLACGMLADRHGRRHPMLVGIIVYVVATAGCLHSATLETLAFWRMVQGIGAAVGPTLAAAVVSDVYGRNRAAEMLSRLAGFMALLPAVMPFVGSLIIVHYDWTGIFVLLLAFAIAMGLGVRSCIPETHVVRAEATGVAEYLRAHLRVCSHLPFLLFTFAASFSFAGIFAYISANSFIILDTLGVEQANFGFTFLAVPLGFFAGSQASALLLKRFGLEQVILAGAAMSLATAAAALACALLGALSLWTLMVPAFFYTAGMGFVLSPAQVGAMKSRPTEMATASGVTGFVRLALASAAGHVALEGFDGTALVLMSVMFACALAAFILSLALFARRKNHA